MKQDLNFIFQDLDVFFKKRLCLREREHMHRSWGGEERERGTHRI